MTGQIACPCCNGLIIMQSLKNMILDLEIELGREILVTSLYRCEKHNAACGGAANSYHMRGMAVDCFVKKSDQPDFIKKARYCGAGGIGIGESFIHCDMGPERSWAYDKDGKVVSIS